MGGDGLFTLSELTAMKSYPRRGRHLFYEQSELLVKFLIESQETPGDFFALARALRSGITLPELIVVSAGKNSGIVVLEGHVRLTAYALVPEAVPAELPVILGTSYDMAQWGLYNLGKR